MNSDITSPVALIIAHNVIWRQFDQGVNLMDSKAKREREGRESIVIIFNNSKCYNEIHHY